MQRLVVVAAPPRACFTFFYSRKGHGTRQGDAHPSTVLCAPPLCLQDGSWVIKQSVGTVPVILGTKLACSFYQTDSYLEATIDVSSSSAAAYITGLAG